VNARANRQSLQQLRIPSKDNPLRVLMSACLSGVACGFDASTYGEFPNTLNLLKTETVKIFKFCPEDYSFGTPRALCDIHGGTGEDVLNGKARVLTDDGQDWTEGMIRASEKMLQLAQNEKIELAIMMDVSAACGSAVIYDGNRRSAQSQYQIGAGVCAAQLIRHSFCVISQRDFAAFEILKAKTQPNYIIDPSKIDHEDTSWFQNYFKGKMNS